MKPKFAFLMSVADESVASGGASVVAAPVAVVQVEEAEAPKELSFVEKVAASFQSKGALAAELAQVKERATNAEAELVTLRQQLQSVTGERDALAGEKQQIANLLQKAQEQAKTVTEQTVETVAQLGFTAAESKTLPGAVEQTESPIKLLEKEYAKATCPVEKGKIAQKMIEAMKAEA